MATVIKQKEITTNKSRMMMMSPRNSIIDFSQYYTFELKIKLNGSWETIPEINFMQHSLGNVIKIDISDLVEFSDITSYTFYLKENKNIEESILGDIDIDNRIVTFTLNDEYSTSDIGKKTYLLVIIEDSFDQGNVNAQIEKFVSDEFTVNIIKSLWSNNLNLEPLPEFSKNALFKPSIELQYNNNTFTIDEVKLGNEGDKFITYFATPFVNTAVKQILIAYKNNEYYGWTYTGVNCVIPETITKNPGTWQYTFVWECENNRRIITPIFTGSVISNFLEKGDLNEIITTKDGEEIQENNELTLVNENSSGVYKLDFTGEEINSKLSSINQLTSDVTNLQNNKISKTSYSTPHSGTFYINGSPIIGGVNGKATLRAYIDSSNYGAQLALTNSLIDDYNGYWANLQVKDKDLINTYNLRLSPKFGIEYRINEDRYPIFHTGNIKTINGNSLLVTDDNTDIAITTDNISISINRLFNTSETLEVGQYYIFNQPGYSEISTTFSFQNTEQPTILEEIFGEIQTYASPLVWSTNLAINWSNNLNNLFQYENQP